MLLLVEVSEQSSACLIQCCVETVRVESRLLVEVSVLLLVEFSVVWSPETSCRGSVSRALGVMELCVRQAIVTTALCTGMNWCDGALCEAGNSYHSIGYWHEVEGS